LALLSEQLGYDLESLRAILLADRRKVILRWLAGIDDTPCPLCHRKRSETYEAEDESVDDSRYLWVARCDPPSRVGEEAVDEPDGDGHFGGGVGIRAGAAARPAGVDFGLPGWLTSRGGLKSASLFHEIVLSSAPAALAGAFLLSLDDNRPPG